MKIFILKYYKSLIITILITILSLLPGSDTPKIHFINIPYLDKYIHFFMYFFLSGIIIFDSKRVGDRNLKFYLIIITAIIIFGITLESIQENYITGRSGEFFDVIANSTGTIIGLIISLLIQENKNTSK